MWKGNPLTCGTARLPIAPFQGGNIWLLFWLPSRSKTIVNSHNQQKGKIRAEGA
jgi:hypothetical protein